MEQIIENILALLRAGHVVDDRELTRLVHAQARAEGRDKAEFAKRRLLPYVRRVQQEDPQLWARWNLTPELLRELERCLRMKPRRSASGVATITVITKPWPCGGNCLYCPSDLRMPKSYLHDEPACARAELNFFDPYLQVASRLAVLSQMGHATDKVELIVLGGTWSDYPQAYQIWFVRELFRALNDGLAQDAGDTDDLEHTDRAAAVFALLPQAAHDRRALYRSLGFGAPDPCLQQALSEAQQSIDQGDLSYNAAWQRVYGSSSAWRKLGEQQQASLEELADEQRINEQAAHRAVGLVIETRPEAVTPDALRLIRALGCTKVQIGVQSTSDGLLRRNGRPRPQHSVARAFELLRAFGFKIHAHAMANLVGATPESDREDYARLMTDAALQPDEVKLYPCALIGSSALRQAYEQGVWKPYEREELLDLLAADVLATPAFCRISRMIRDFSSHDILAGCKTPNLRQLVEDRLGREGIGSAVNEIRYREIATDVVERDELRVQRVCYTTTNTSEYFLQWVTPQGRIAGFLRLSLPSADYVRAHAKELPIELGEAMIREVHIYGSATPLAQAGASAQHRGLGRELIEQACELASQHGYHAVNVISAVGTRGYYRRLGFLDAGLYQRRPLDSQV